MPTPLFTAFGQKFRTLAYLRFLRDHPGLHYWQFVARTNEGLIVKHNRFLLHLTPESFQYFFKEIRLWRKYYLPNFSLKGKTVLDVGAGCGETAFFYFCAGAMRIIAIEPAMSEFLIDNARLNKWNLRTIPRKFRLSDLKLDFDFMKMDGEGCEKLLLGLRGNRLPPCVIEAHSRFLINRLAKKFELRVLHYLNESVALLGHPRFFS